MIKERKNLLKSLYALLPSFLLQLHQFSVKRLIKRERFFFITNFRWSLNVEVARLPIVCFDAINRHTFFFFILAWKMLFIARFNGPRELANMFTARANVPRQERTRQNGKNEKAISGWEKWNIKTINRRRGALSVTHWWSSELWLLVARKSRIENINLLPCAFTSDLQTWEQWSWHLKWGSEMYRLW